MQLLRQVLRAPFFHQLRTEKQLGYIVFVAAMGLKEVPGSMMIVQSPTLTSEQLSEEISRFLSDYTAKLPADLRQHQQAVIGDLLEQPKNLAEQARRYWSNILHKNLSFDRRQQLADAVAAVTPASLADYYQRVAATPARRLWITSSVAKEQPLDDALQHSMPLAYPEALKEAVEAFYQYP